MAPLKKRLIALVGPTAVGKTETAIQLANKLNSPIISFDSRQFYHEMNIGTAKPKSSDLLRAKHYFIDSHSIHETYNSGKFEIEALKLLNKLFETFDDVIAVGGSGLYINALVNGIDDIPTNTDVREKLIERWQKEGLPILVNELESIDKAYFEEGDMSNPRRVIRALEVFYVSGKPYSYFRKNKPKSRNFETLWIGLNLPREILFERINLRVDKMIEDGLYDEIKSLHPFKNLKALKTVGYQEFFDQLDGQYDFNQAIHLVKRNTRVFAKKQIAWFNKNPDIHWFEPSELDIILKLCQRKSLK